MGFRAAAGWTSAQFTLRESNGVHLLVNFRLGVACARSGGFFRFHGVRNCRPLIDGFRLGSLFGHFGSLLLPCRRGNCCRLSGDFRSSSLFDSPWSLFQLGNAERCRPWLEQSQQLKIIRTKPGMWEAPSTALTTGHRWASQQSFHGGPVGAAGFRAAASRAEGQFKLPGHFGNRSIFFQPGGGSGTS